MRWLSVSLTALSVFALAGCGADRSGRAAPRIERAAARQLAADSSQIAGLVDSGRMCEAAHAADRLRDHAERAITAGHVPALLRDDLLASADALVNELSCNQQDEQGAPPPGSMGHDQEEHD
jgi:hypothetical protein